MCDFITRPPRSSFVGMTFPNGGRVKADKRLTLLPGDWWRRDRYFTAVRSYSGWMVVGNERHRLFEEKYRSYPYRKPGLGASAAPVVGDF